MKSLNLLLSVTLGHQLGRRTQRSASSCPSEECWDFDYTNGKCTLKANQSCVSISCAYDSMRVEFSGNYFGVEDGNTDVFDDNLNTQFDGSRFHINCPLGDCGMVASVNDDGTKLVYSMNVNTADLSKITVSDEGSTISIYRGSDSVNLGASCEYSTTVAVSSGEFDVQSVTAGTYLHQNGDLSSGFGLNLYSDEQLSSQIRETVFTGQRLWAEVEWKVSSAQSQIHYYLDSCQVELQADPPIIAPIVENNCYSSALGITKLGSKNEWIVSQKSGFTFATFSSNQNQAESQRVTVKCDIKLCLLSDNKCVINKQESECPRAGSGYKFTPTGDTFVSESSPITSFQSQAYKAVNDVQEIKYESPSGDLPLSPVQGTDRKEDVKQSDESCDLSDALAKMTDVSFRGSYEQGGDSYQLVGTTKGSITQVVGSKKYNLGNFDGIVGTTSTFSGGTMCGSHGARKSTIHWSCGTKFEVTQSTEPKTCDYHFFAILPCCAVDNAASWTEWDRSECSTTCGYGTQTLTRTCITGSGCDGDDSKIISCNIVQCNADFIKTLVDDKIIFTLQSKAYVSYLFSDVNGKKATCVDHQDGTNQNLVLIRNPGDREDGYSIKSNAYDTHLSARGTNPSDPVMWTSKSASYERWQFEPQEGTKYWTIRSITFNNYLQSSAGNERFYRWGPPRTDFKCGETLNADCHSNMCCSSSNVCGEGDNYCKCDGCVDFRSARSRPGTRMSWSIQKDCSDCSGSFGFRLLDKHGEVLFVRPISFVDNSGYIDVDAIVEKILFNTDNRDGTNLLIQVTSTIDHLGAINLAGRTQQYKCVNCDEDSDSFLLNRLYLDTDMNGPRNGDAQCVTGCEFNRVSEPSDVFVLPVPNSYMSWQIVPVRTIKIFEYHVDDVRLIDIQPETVATMTVTNTCSEKLVSRCHDQSSILSTSETKTTTSSFSLTSGLITTTSLEFSAGLPKLLPVTLSAKTTVTISLSSSQTTGTTTSSTKTWTESSSCYAKPGTVTKCEYMVKKTTIDVPWTITWNTGELTHGMYRGIDFIDLNLIIKTYLL